MMNAGLHKELLMRLPHASVLFFAILAGHCFADDAKKTAKDIDPQSVRHQAELMSRAMLAEDYKTVADFMYPRLVELLGGRERLIEHLKLATEAMKKNGYALKSYDVKDPSQIVDSGETILAVVPQAIVMKTPKGEVTQDGFLLG